MAEKIDDSQDEVWMRYKDRKEWSDVVPIKQNDGPTPVVKIAYSADFEDVYDYFRAVVAAGELSMRALTLTEDAIQMNAANYTVWQYRRRILEHLKCDLQDELLFCREMIEANPKNYQVWHHRRVIVGWLGDGSKELQLTKIIFAQDAKNYHAWEHRQWALRTFGCYEGELQFTADLLREDARNNSAWNHRYFVLTRTSGLTPEVLQSELVFTQEAIEKLVDNESPWAYIKGLLMDTSGDEEEIEKSWCTTTAWCWNLLAKAVSKNTMSSNSNDGSPDDNGSDDVCNFPYINESSRNAFNGLPTDTECSNLIDKVPSIAKGCISPHLLIGLLDCIVHQLEKTEDPARKETPLKIALQVCDTLAKQHDCIRVRYWNYVRRQLQHEHRSSSASA
ncbi:protein farnesyltransferase/geranylgeranyltransferase type-1 subunit alpha [Hyalella azteca]|uniref:Protein farnesyltransferase/geranylgeranyltransferase type-1 subunit alpha n=1 Tax=Hyalella azteca TaxID=294128 RepID=A0A8B7NG30_HYAAZ|nr:protein farnesyltransferase/geranylgeranyltransferase type-1 subunit alpha [Hyalella azteca]